jgi:Na+-translocating ferredoxin:NAD+ oxidoreductase RnfG subunit
MPVPNAKPFLLRAYRAGVLVLIAWLIHDQQKWLTDQRQATLTVERVRDFFPDAKVLGAVESNGLQRVWDGNENTLGFVAQTAPLSDRIIGYSGPTNTLIAFDAQARVTGLRILHSDDTPDHLSSVLRKRSFFDAFKGLKLGAPDAKAKVDAVSGATLTSTAIAEGVLKRLGQKASSLRFPKEVSLEEVRAVVPEAAALRPVKSPVGFVDVLDAAGKVIAKAGRTAPVSDGIIGYKGPTDSLIILNAEGTKLEAFRLRKTYDTQDYVAYVTGDKFFMNLFNSMEVGKLANLDFQQAKIEGVSGATQTSWSVAEGLKERAKSIVASAQDKDTAGLRIAFKLQDAVLLGVVLLSLVMTFTSLRGKAWARWLHHALLILGAGLFCGAMLSQGLLVGWAKHGIPWQSSPMLVLLVAFALAVPLFQRRQFYCHHYCPHGALQQVLAHRLKWQLKVPHTLGRWLDKMPVALLIVVLVVAMLGLNVDLNALEAFDAWLIRIAGWSAIVIAVTGLVASLFVPMAYCRYGCPTGALLKFVRYSGQGDGFGRKDLLALAFVLAAAVMHWKREALIAWIG